MKIKSLLGISLAALGFASMGDTRGSDIEARITLRGSVQNNAARQTVQGGYWGKGEFLGRDGNVNGNFRTESNQRPPQVTVYFDYPIEVYLRASRSSRSVSDTFDTTVELRRRYLNFGRYGKIYLNRPVDPRRPGRQILRGRGILRYDF